MPFVLAGKAPAEASVTKSDGVEAEIEAAIAAEKASPEGRGLSLERWALIVFGRIAGVHAG